MTFSYRVYLRSPDGSYPADTMERLTYAAADTIGLCVEEANLPADGAFFRLLVLEDAAFRAWHLSPLASGEGSLPFVTAASVSDAACEPPALWGVSLKPSGTESSPLPLGVGRLPNEENVMVGVTSRGCFSAAFPGIVQNRSLVVYYDTADGSLLTPLLTPVLEDSGLVYTIQDDTPSSDWALQRQALGYLIGTVELCFPFGVLLPGGLEVATSIYLHMLTRRKEFALLRSAGMQHRELRSMLFVECCLSAGCGLLPGILMGLFCSTWVAGLLRLSWGRVLSWQAPVVCILCFFLVSVCAFFLVMRVMERLVIAQELRQE